MKNVQDQFDESSSVEGVVHQSTQESPSCRGKNRTHPSPYFKWLTSDHRAPQLFTHH